MYYFYQHHQHTFSTFVLERVRDSECKSLELCSILIVLCIIFQKRKQEQNTQLAFPKAAIKSRAIFVIYNLAIDYHLFAFVLSFHIFTRH